MHKFCEVDRELAFCLVSFWKSVGPLGGRFMRLESQRLDAGSVGICSHLCPQRCSPTLWRLVFENSDRKFGHAIVAPLLTIGITVVGRRFGRATSLGDRRLLFGNSVEPLDGRVLRLELRRLGTSSVGIL